MSTAEKNTNPSSTNEPRKPFKAPTLRRQAGLTETTAERTFTFTTGS